MKEIASAAQNAMRYVYFHSEEDPFNESLSVLPMEMWFEILNFLIPLTALEFANFDYVRRSIGDEMGKFESITYGLGKDIVDFDLVERIICPQMESEHKDSYIQRIGETVEDVNDVCRKLAFRSEKRDRRNKSYIVQNYEALLQRVNLLNGIVCAVQEALGVTFPYADSTKVADDSVKRMIKEVIHLEHIYRNTLSKPVLYSFTRMALSERFNNMLEQVELMFISKRCTQREPIPYRFNAKTMKADLNAIFVGMWNVLSKNGERKMNCNVSKVIGEYNDTIHYLALNGYMSYNILVTSATRDFFMNVVHTNFNKGIKSRIDKAADEFNWIDSDSEDDDNPRVSYDSILEAKFPNESKEIQDVLKYFQTGNEDPAVIIQYDETTTLAYTIMNPNEDFRLFDPATLLVRKYRYFFATGVKNILQCDLKTLLTSKEFNDAKTKCPILLGGGDLYSAYYSAYYDSEERTYILSLAHIRTLFYHICLVTLKEFGCSAILAAGFPDPQSTEIEEFFVNFGVVFSHHPQIEGRVCSYADFKYNYRAALKKCYVCEPTYERCARIMMSDI